MVLGVVASRWRTPTELRHAVGIARPLVRADVYSSDALRIKRVATETAGTYYIVTESDILFDEDYEAMKRLDGELMAPWRKRVVETDFWAQPHRQFPMSNSFRVHLVHPEVRPEWEAHGRQAHACRKYDSLRESA